MMSEQIVHVQIVKRLLTNQSTIVLGRICQDKLSIQVFKQANKQLPKKDKALS